jgi:N-acetyl-gamma-glutamylphosphate reductase
MKLIIAGASGYVGQEVVRQSLKRPEITSVIALSRKAITAPADAGADASKLKSVTVPSYEEYPDDARTQFAGTDAVIWSEPTSCESYPTPD